jgi:predicted nucleotidyltransferase
MLERKAQIFFRNPHLIQRFGIKLAYFFGSAADGRFTAQSDLDIGVLFVASRRSQDLLQKSALLQIELRDQIPHAIDFVILNFASPLVKHEVIAGKKSLCRARKNTPGIQKRQLLSTKNLKKMNLKFKRKMSALV